MKNDLFLFFFFWGGVGVSGRVGSGVTLGGQGGCERRSEAFVKIQKKNWGGQGGGVGRRRVGVQG